MFAAKALHEAISLQFQEDKLEEFAWYGLFGGDFCDPDRVFGLGLG